MKLYSIEQYLRKNRQELHNTVVFLIKYHLINTIYFSIEDRKNVSLRDFVIDIKQETLYTIENLQQKEG